MKKISKFLKKKHTLIAISVICIPIVFIFLFVLLLSVEVEWENELVTELRTSNGTVLLLTKRPFGLGGGPHSSGSGYISLYRDTIDEKNHIQQISYGGIHDSREELLFTVSSTTNQAEESAVIYTYNPKTKELRILEK